jgi:hypothetical protein
MQLVAELEASLGSEVVWARSLVSHFDHLAASWKTVYSYLNLILTQVQTSFALLRPMMF